MDLVIQAFTSENDKIIVQTAIYHPFASLSQNKRNSSYLIYIVIFSINSILLSVIIIASISKADCIFFV